MRANSMLGRRRTNAEGQKKVTGSLKYTFDIKFPGMLVGKALYPDYPRARIARLDTSAAENIAGVEAVVTHQDIPGEKFFGFVIRDQPVLVINEVHFIGDMIVGVAAVSEEIAEQALLAIEVEYEPLPGIFDVMEARRPDAALARSDIETNIIHAGNFHHGESVEGFKDAEVVVEDSYTTACMDHLFLETECSIAIWDSDVLTVYASGQYPHRDRQQLAEVLDLPINKVRVIYSHVGGGFGGKDEIHTQFVTALLSRKAKKPVKMVRTREESMLTHVKRQGFSIRYKTGATRDGQLVAIQADITGDAGPYSNMSVPVVGFSAEMASGCYQIPNARVDYFTVATNNLAGGAFRGFGGPEVAFAQEQNMDRVAEQIGMDPIDFRIKNSMGKGTTMPTGAHIYYEIGCQETMIKAAEIADWFNREEWLQRQPAPHLRRGLGVASIWAGMGIGRNLLDNSAVSLEIASDGTVILQSSTTEMGQGALSIQALLAAQMLGAKERDVRVILADTDVVPDAGVTSASRTTYMVGNAVIRAAAPIRQSLVETAAEMLEVHPDEIDMLDGEVFAVDSKRDRLTLAEVALSAWENNRQLVASGFYKMWHPDEPINPFNYPVSHSIFAYATQIV
jgi:CO/xanthine dehydrogenase Mo-binding subunit